MCVCVCVCVCVDVTIGFEFPTYSVDEEDGPQEVCAVVRSGGSLIPVTVSVNSRDGTATTPCTWTIFTFHVLGSYNFK